ncbi:MAG: hypothetical protein KDD62_13365, partial [Bdellovibrionales bacterium]|nr:hypothetical protein [Bdellovibrionales bacterium]
MSFQDGTSMLLSESRLETALDCLINSQQQLPEQVSIQALEAAGKLAILRMSEQGTFAHPELIIERHQKRISDSNLSEQQQGALMQSFISEIAEQIQITHGSSMSKIQISFANGHSIECYRDGAQRFMDLLGNGWLEQSSPEVRANYLEQLASHTAFEIHDTISHLYGDTAEAHAATIRSLLDNYRDQRTALNGAVVTSEEGHEVLSSILPSGERYETLADIDAGNQYFAFSMREFLQLDLATSDQDILSCCQVLSYSQATTSTCIVDTLPSTTKKLTGDELLAAFAGHHKIEHFPLETLRDPQTMHTLEQRFVSDCYQAYFDQHEITGIAVQDDGLIELQLIKDRSISLSTNEALSMLRDQLLAPALTGEQKEHLLSLYAEVSLASTQGSMRETIERFDSFKELLGEHFPLDDSKQNQILGAFAKQLAVQGVSNTLSAFELDRVHNRNSVSFNAAVPIHELLVETFQLADIEEISAQQIAEFRESNPILEIQLAQLEERLEGHSINPENLLIPAKT